MEQEEESASRLATAVIKPDILLKEIMMRLPARLLRLGLVDKRWRRITSGPKFCNRHTRHHWIHRSSETALLIRTQFGFFYFKPTTRALEPFDFTLSPFTTIVQSTHGLMLLECRDSKDGPKYYCVANPTTKRARKLLIAPDPLNPGEEIVPFFLKFDPSESEYYKVGFLRIVSENHTLDVYDSENREWQQSPCPDTFRIPNNTHKIIQRRICLKNRVYTVGADGETLYMDLENKTYGMIWLPSDEYIRNYVLEWNGDVYCISMYWQSSEVVANTLFIHKLTESGEWAEFHGVELVNQPDNRWPEMEGDLIVLGIVGIDSFDHLSILFNCLGKIVVYRIFDHGCYKVLFDLKDHGRGPLYMLEDHQFKETLTLV